MLVLYAYLLSIELDIRQSPKSEEIGRVVRMCGPLGPVDD